MLEKLLTVARKLAGSARTESPYYRRVLRGTVRVGARQVRLEEGRPLRFGRAAGNDVVLQMGSASAQHAQLKLENGRVWIFDLGSTNGTISNGKLIPPKTWVPVRSTDRIQLADHEISLDLELEPLPAEPTVRIPAPPTEVPTVERREPQNRKTRATPPKGVRETAADRRAADIRRLLIGTGLGIVLLLVATGTCAGLTANPASGKNVQLWRVIGDIELPTGEQEVELILTIPEISKPLRYTYQLDKKGFYRYDIDLRIDSATRPQQLDIELRQNGKVVDSKLDLSFPTTGRSLEVPLLGGKK